MAFALLAITVVAVLIWTGNERDKVADRLTPEELQAAKDATAAYLSSHEGQVEQVAGET